MCEPPKTSDLSISDPPGCLTGPTSYGTHCVMSCPSGYRDSAVLYCNKNAKWEGRDVECKGRLLILSKVECKFHYHVSILSLCCFILN